MALLKSRVDAKMGGPPASFDVMTELPVFEARDETSAAVVVPPPIPHRTTTRYDPAALR